MIVGHLPAGYILCKHWMPAALRTAKARNAWVAAGLAGSVFPDIDMLYFHLVDARAHHHHTYFTHYPVLWLALLAASAALTRGAQGETLRLRAWLAVAFSANGLLHMLLDSIVGDIWWLAPWVDQPFAMFHVEPLHLGHWVWSFILHWSFALELALVGWAAALLLRARGRVAT